jgi:hypothetical protein
VNLTVAVPTWAVEVILARARAAEVSFDEALLMSLDISTPDLAAETCGWARALDVPVPVIAERLHYSRSTVEGAVTRYRNSRLPNVVGPS